MPEYLSPGVYIEEFEIGARPIEGVSTSTAGFLGEAERGPTTPRLVTSWLQYQRMFGNYFGLDKYLPYSVQGFFENGGLRCYIGRVVKAGDSPATAATHTLTSEGNSALIVDAIGEGTWGNRLAVKVAPGNNTGFRISAFYWKKEPSPLYDPETDIRTTPRPDAIESYDDLSISGSSPDYYGKKVNDLSNLIKLSKGTVDAIPDVHVDNAQGGANSTITLASIASVSNSAYVGMQIEIIEGLGNGQIRTITAYDGTSKEATVNENWNKNPDNTSKYSLSWPISLLRDGTESSFNTGTAQNGATNNTIVLAAVASTADDKYKDKKIEIIRGTGKGEIRMITDYVGATKIATIDQNWTINPDNTSVYNIYPAATALMIDDYVRSDTDEPGKRKGLTAFAEAEDISIIYSPNVYSVSGLVGALISHCELLKNRFAIIDAPKSSSDISSKALKPRDDRQTQYAAFYYPWIKIINPESGSLLLIPPGGYMAGIYARSDTERGVHKAPANESVRGAANLEFPITKGEQDILNPRGVNVIRAFSGQGILVWGARTLSSNSLWKYINVRRLFIYVEGSINKGTQWVVFEPNDDKLWARVRATITQFLTGVWRSGALMGLKAEEAFFVKCDRTTMTQDDIDNGRLICIIGIAPVKPAEFVIFRIAQWAGGSVAKE
jgi:phage tail sheath protein FI